MAFPSFISILLLPLLLSFAAASHPSFRPKSLVIPVRKDRSTLQYIANIHQRTPLVSVDLTLDLGGEHLWVDCEKGFVSSTYRPTRCGTVQCTRARSIACDSDDNTCVVFPVNPIIPLSTSGDVGTDIVSVQSTNGKNPGQNVTVKNFSFVCEGALLLQKLANGVKGMAGLGRANTSVPSQFFAAFSLRRKFALCLSSGRSDGVLFFGDGPYVFLPGYDASAFLTYTPLILNTGSPFAEPVLNPEYFIGVKAIKINEKKVSINKTLLSIRSDGHGGAMISTASPYTALETSIYKAVTEAFVKAMPSHVPRVASVVPFGACFDSKKLTSTRLGYGVPTIGLVLQSKKVVWTITGANSMVQVSDEVACLGFVDGGVDPRHSIVIGGHQIEDKLLQFDLASSRLGFSSSLLGAQTTCGNFNFTSNA